MDCKTFDNVYQHPKIDNITTKKKHSIIKKNPGEETLQHPPLPPRIDLPLSSSKTNYLKELNTKELVLEEIYNRINSVYVRCEYSIMFNIFGKHANISNMAYLAVRSAEKVVDDGGGNQLLLENRLVFQTSLIKEKTEEANKEACIAGIVKDYACAILEDGFRKRIQFPDIYKSLLESMRKNSSKDYINVFMSEIGDFEKRIESMKFKAKSVSNFLNKQEGTNDEKLGKYKYLLKWFKMSDDEMSFKPHVEKFLETAVYDGGDSVESSSPSPQQIDGIIMVLDKEEEEFIDNEEKAVLVYSNVRKEEEAKKALNTGKTEMKQMLMLGGDDGEDGCSTIISTASSPHHSSSSSSETSVVEMMNIIPKSATAVVADLRADKASTFVKSKSRLSGAESAAWFIAGVRTHCPSNVRLTGEELRFFHLENARRIAQTRRFGNIPSNAPAPIFEHAIETDATYGLFSGIVSSACSSTCVNGSASNDLNVAAEIASMFMKKSYFDTHCQILISSMCIPLISPTRFKIGSSNWLEIGRSLATAYRKAENLGTLGLSMWVEASAQKTFLYRARDWMDKIFSPKEEIPQSERGFIGWLFNKDGRGAAFLRGESVSNTVEIDPFNSLYSSSSSENPKPDIITRAISNDPFTSRLYGFIFDRMSEVLPGISTDPTGSMVSAIAEDFFNFREQYRDTMREAHAELVKSFYIDGKRDINKSARRIGLEINQVNEKDIERDGAFDPKMSALAYVPDVESTILGTKGSKPETTKERVLVSVGQTAMDVNRKIEMKNEHTIANARVKNFGTPEDYEWGSSQEINCASMFMDAVRKQHLLRDTGARREELLNRIMNSYPATNLFLKSGVDGDIGKILLDISRMRSQEEIDITVSAAIEKIASSEFSKPCGRAWEEFESEKRRLTSRTLGGYAREDSPMNYEVWHERWAMTALHSAVYDKEARESHIGDFAARILWQMYMCVPKTTVGGSSCASWFKFDTNANYLRPINGNSELCGDIGKHVGGALDTALNLANEHIRQTTRKAKTFKSSDGKEEEEYLTETVDMSNSIAKELSLIKKSAFTERGRGVILSSMRSVEILSCANFSDVVNQQETLVAFENGVVDMDGSKNAICFRPGKAEDFITMSTKIPMPYGGEITPAVGVMNRIKKDAKPFSESHPDVVSLMVYLNKVFPDKELLDYALRDMSSYLFGRNSEKLFRIWSGGGNNSKSILVKIIQKVLGDYCFDLPPEAVSSKQIRNASGPSPEMAQGDGARLGVMAEPTNGLELDDGLIKRMTGGDRTFSRKLHDNGGSKTACYKVTMCCNDPPSFSSLSEAGKKRITITPFLSTWSDKAPDSIEEQWEALKFPIDVHFERNVPRLARALAWLMFHKYIDYKRFGLANKPKIVEEYVADYWRSVDMYLSFQEDCVITVTESPTEAIVVAQDLYNKFITWFSSQYAGSKVPSFVTFRSNVIRKDRLGPFHIVRGNGGKSSWIGYAINTEEDDTSSSHPPSPSI